MQIIPSEKLLHMQLGLRSSCMHAFLGELGIGVHRKIFRTLSDGSMQGRTTDRCW